MGLPKKFGTLGNGIKVRTIIEIIATICLGIEIGVGIEMVIEEERMTTRIRVALMLPGNHDASSRNLWMEEMLLKALKRYRK